MRTYRKVRRKPLSEIIQWIRIERFKTFRHLVITLKLRLKYQLDTTNLVCIHVFASEGGKFITESLFIKRKHPKNPYTHFS